MLISVIIPAYNVEDYISSCLDSVFNQRYKNIEIICIDDGSTDKTLSVLLKYQEKFSGNFKVIQQRNLGAPLSRNNGLEAASGDFIQFLDADDLLMPEKIAHQVEMIL